jgi:hypothetical protein
MRELLTILIMAIVIIKGWDAFSEYYAGPTDTTIAVGEP